MIRTATPGRTGIKGCPGFDAASCSGIIPHEIGLLTNLRAFILDAGTTNLDVTGTLPSELGLLLQLTNFQLQRSKVSGTLPSALSALQKVVRFSVYNSQLSGILPPELSNMTSLRRFDVMGLNGSGKVTGSIPTSFTALTSLSYLELSSNKLSGELPAGLFSLPKLLRLFVRNNKLSGTIPVEMFFVPDIRFTARSNEITGTLPRTVAETGYNETDFGLWNYIDIPENSGLVGPIPDYFLRRDIDGTPTTALQSLTITDTNFCAMDGGVRDEASEILSVTLPPCDCKYRACADTYHNIGDLPWFPTFPSSATCCRQNELCSESTCAGANGLTPRHLNANKDGQSCAAKFCVPNQLLSAGGCCSINPTCAGHTCSKFTHVPVQLNDKVCLSKTCADFDCCQNNPGCNGVQDCYEAVGYFPALNPGACPTMTCTSEACTCDANTDVCCGGTCVDYNCDVPLARNDLNDTFTCATNPCTPAECCVDPNAVPSLSASVSVSVPPGAQAADDKQGVDTVAIGLGAIALILLIALIVGVRIARKNTRRGLVKREDAIGKQKAASKSSGGGSAKHRAAAKAATVITVVVDKKNEESSFVDADAVEKARRLSRSRLRKLSIRSVERRSQSQSRHRALSRGTSVASIGTDDEGYDTARSIGDELKMPSGSSHEVDDAAKSISISAAPPTTPVPTGTLRKVQAPTTPAPIEMMSREHSHTTGDAARSRPTTPTTPGTRPATVAGTLTRPKPRPRSRPRASTKDGHATDKTDDSGYCTDGGGYRTDGSGYKTDGSQH
jgi:hypothetical protein